MGAPQLEDGYTRIAHELLEAIIAFPFSKRQYKVVFAVIRETYGFHKKAKVMSYGELGRLTDLKRQHIITTVSELTAMRVLKVERSGVRVRGGELNSIGLNKNHSEWMTSPETVTSPKTGLVPKSAPTSPKTVRDWSQNSDPLKDKKDKKDRGSLPEWLDGEVWEDFITFRREIKKPLTKTAISRLLKKLERMHADGADPNAALEQSIENRWQGVFEPRGTFVKQKVVV